MVERTPWGESALMLAFNNVVKEIKTYKAHVDEAKEDLTDFETAVAAFEAQLDAVGVELSQMAEGVRDEHGRAIYKELMATEKFIQKQIEDVRADTHIAERMALAIEESLQKILDDQTTLLASFTLSTKQ